MSALPMPERYLESQTDVVIIGAGPAGLMVAWWMARCGINARIIDSRGTKVINGHADSLRPRTEEILDSLGCGVQEKVEAEGYLFENIRNWHREPEGELIRDSSRHFYGDYINDLPSPFVTMTLSQGRIERFLIDAMEEISNSKLQVERGVVADAFAYDGTQEKNPNGYPIELVLRTLSGSEANPEPAPGSLGGRDNIAKANLPRDETGYTYSPKQLPGTVERVRTKYLIGCDGARSWLRNQLKYKMEGASTTTTWGVLDVIALSNFPDMGYPTLIKSDLGTMLLVPRERNLTRLYIPLSEVTVGERFDRSSITLVLILAKAKAFFAPFTFDFKVCEWWSVYQIGQRVSESNSHPGNRIFLAGDAVHVHSPKVGLGMNVSMQDGYNLGWKVAMAAAGAAVDNKKLLSTYNGERYPVAQKLVAYDRALFGEQGILDTTKMMKFLEEFRDFSEGLKLDYPESILAAKSTSNQSAATGLTVGESFKHHKVLGHATSQLYWTTKIFQSDGRFRIVLMAGDIRRAEQMERVKRFCKRLESDRKDSNEEETSLLYTRYPYRFTPPSGAQDNDVPPGQHPSISFHHQRPRTSMISLLAIHSAEKTNESITLFDFPAALRGTLDDEYYGYDFSRVLVDEAVHYDRYCDGRAYERWGIDRNTGAVVVVRPDMHVGWIGDLEDTDALETYFANILR